MLDEKNNIIKIIQIFKEHNLKVTPQRATIYSYLLSTSMHPNVDTIYKNIKPIIPAISLATVYKTLNVLVKSNLIKEINMCEDNFRYDANIEPHGHIKCNSCNNVFDIELNNILDIKSISKYKIDSFDLLLYGKCNKCL